MLNEIYLNTWACVTPSVLQLLSQWRGQRLSEVWLNWDEKQYKDGHQLHWSSYPIIISINQQYWAFDSGSCNFCMIQSDLDQQRLGQALDTNVCAWQLNPLPELKHITGHTIKAVHLLEYQDPYIQDTLWHGVELLTTGGTVVFFLDCWDFNGLAFEVPKYVHAHCVETLRRQPSKTF